MLRSTRSTESFTLHNGLIAQINMKYELYSSFRDRNIYPSPGEFLAEINTAQRNKVAALDPVCLSAPMITWEAGSAYKLKTVSYQPVNNEYVVLVL